MKILIRIVPHIALLWGDFPHKAGGMCENIPIPTGSNQTGSV